MLNKLANAFLDLLYPPKCPSCHGQVDSHGAWCAGCLKKLEKYRVINKGMHGLRALDSCEVLFDYSGALKRIIHDLKFRLDKQHVRHLTWLLDTFAMNIAKRKFDMVVAVPLDGERMAERGFNQTELIFKPWALAHGLLWSKDILMRTRSTAPQWELNRLQRRKNIQGAFKVICPETVKSSRILLVDDIFTTGITMETCAAELKKAKASLVTGLALASNID